MADQRRRFRPVLGLVSLLLVSLAWAAMPAEAADAAAAQTQRPAITVFSPERTGRSFPHDVI